MRLIYQYLEPDRIIGSRSFKTTESFLKAMRYTQVGWHYRVDLAWILWCLQKLPIGAKILDAGGGRGPLQFLLAELGYEVSNIDLFHKEPPQWMRSRYNITVEALPSFSRTSYADHIEHFGYRSKVVSTLEPLRNFPPIVLAKWATMKIALSSWRKAQNLQQRPIGRVFWYRGNLAAIPEIGDNSFDALVSLSSLEHITLDILPSAVSELKRVVKQDGAWAVTTSATDKARGWWHTPSQGYCFSTSELRTIFEAMPAAKQRPAAILSLYRQNDYLKNNLSKFYFKSGNNGMPWGRWDPQYIPVGISSGN